MSERLTPAQFARAEKNKQRAVLLRKSRLARKPYHCVGIKQQAIDSGAGFLVDPDEEEEENNRVRQVETTAPILGAIDPECQNCGTAFQDSFLLLKFNELVCDGCRDNDPDDKYALITKTDAKQKYLLKDCDLDKRNPPLQFIIKKNPHHSSWGDMKLYLKLQVIKRSQDIWGGDANLEMELDKRAANKQIMKQKKFAKNLKELRQAVRTSTWQRELTNHVHEFPAEGEDGCETYHEKTDSWSKTCRTCGYTLTYEKM
ncbi:DNA repair protein complementing XP-A cells-like [Corticium candelabrum]|uniref:DNA repair protein complementing XP-A cells-like n=1 Tax=Corticium candelabrum TaxID=121492 RepID=UPI002E26BD94|nr:DNA repair protein complementing XP-A cells-like [Corticium candelabrum]